MKLFLFCSFVCFSTLFVGTVFAGDGFSTTVLPLATEFLNCHFTQAESKSFFAPHPEEIKDIHGKVIDTFDLPGYLRWPSLEGVTEEEEGKRTGLTIQAVVNDIYTSEEKSEDTPIIIFGSQGLKGVAAMRFAIKQKTDKPNSKIVVFLPSKRVQISISDAFNATFLMELAASKLKQDFKVFETLDTFNAFLTANPKFKDGFIVEGLFGIGFRSEFGLNPELVPIMEKLFELHTKGWKIISVDVPVLYNVDAGTFKGPLPTDLVSLYGTADAKDFAYNQVKDHELCDPPLRTLPIVAKTFKGDGYTPFAVIFIGFLKPCYNGLNKLPDVKYIYLGGHLLDPLAVNKLLEVKSIKTRCPALKFSMFPTYTKNVLFHKIKPSTV